MDPPIAFIERRQGEVRLDTPVCLEASTSYTPSEGSLEGFDDTEANEEDADIPAASPQKKSKISKGK